MANVDKQCMRIIRLDKVLGKTGLSRSTVYERMNVGTFPKQVKLGARAVGWLESEVDAWLISCIENRSAWNESITN